MIVKDVVLLTACAAVSMLSPDESNDANLQWSRVGLGSFSAVRSMIAFDDGSGSSAALFATGYYVDIGPPFGRSVASWNKTSHVWEAAGGLTWESVRALLSFAADGDSPVLLAATFDASGWTPTGGWLKEWNGSSWTVLTGGLNGSINALAGLDDGNGPAVFLGGRFTETADEQPLNYIAKWDGSELTEVGGGLNGEVRTLIVHDDGSGPALYAGGDFTMAGSVEANRIARWDGSEWSAVGEGMNNRVRALTVHDDGNGPALYAGGDFTTADAAPASRIAKWDGTSWSALGDGMDSVVAALASFDDGSGPALYAGGGFTMAGGVEAHLIAKWNGEDWASLNNTGLNNMVLTFAVYDDGRGGGDALYAGGYFTAAGGVPAARIARWGRPPACPPDLNVDGTVDLADLVRVIENWGSEVATGDVDNNGATDLDDLLAVIGNWGGCPSSEENR